MGYASVLGALLDAPTRIKAAIASSGILVVLASSAFVLTCVGYPRPFLTHHSMDIESYARSIAERLVQHSLDIRVVLVKFPDNDVVRDLVKAFAPLKAFAEAQGASEAIDKDLPLDSAKVDQVRDGILGMGGGGNVLREAVALGQVRGVLVADILIKRAGVPITGDQVPPDVQKAACAISDVRYLCTSVVPAISIMHRDRTRKMDLPETVKFHMWDDVKVFVFSTKSSFANVRTVRKSTMEIADRFLLSAERFTDIMMFGESREHFGAIFKLVPMMLKLIPQIFKMIPPVISMIFPIATLLTEVLKVLIDSIDDIIDLLRIGVKVLVYVSKALTRGPMEGLVVLVRAVLGLALRVVLTLTRAISRILISWLLAVWYPALNTLWLSVVFVGVLVTKFVIALADFLSDGSMRFLARTDEHPEAWWTIASAERGNKHTRNIVSWRPCARGYVVSRTGLFCDRERTRIPAFSPAAQIMQRYITGNSGRWGRAVPDRDAVSQEVYARLKEREFASALAGTSKILVRDLLKTICVCYTDVLGDGKDIQELVFHLGLLPDSSGSQFSREAYRHRATPAGIKVIISASTIAAVGIAARLAYS